MRFFTIFLTTAALLSAQTATSARKKAAPPAARTTVMTDEQKTIYALGLSLYASLGQLNLTPGELLLVKRGMTDAAAGKPAVDLKAWGPKIEALAKARSSSAAGAYLTKAAVEPGMVKSASGLLFKELKPGTGASPAAQDTVKVNYRGTFTDGKEFDSSPANEPAEFPLNHVIKCWTEGVQKMKVGGKARLVCPSDIAYGDQGRGRIPGGATLVFDIELLQVTPAK